MGIPASMCPQCSVQGQQHVHTMNEVGMQVNCDVGHQTVIHVKFTPSEITMTDAKTGRLIRYDRIKEPEIEEREYDA